MWMLVSLISLRCAADLSVSWPAPGCRELSLDLQQMSNSHHHRSEQKSGSRGDLLQLPAGPFHHLSSAIIRKKINKEDQFVVYSS